MRSPLCSLRAFGWIAGIMCGFSLGAAAQIRREGSFPFRQSNQEQIEAALDEAFAQGRLTNRLDAWEHLFPALVRYRTLQPFDYERFASLRSKGYYIDEWDTKTYVIYLQQNRTFYVARVVDCQEIPQLQHGNRCALGITKIRPADSTAFEVRLTRTQRKAYLDTFYQVVVCSGAVQVRQGR